MLIYLVDVHLLGESPFIQRMPIYLVNAYLIGKSPLGKNPFHPITTHFLGKHPLIQQHAHELQNHTSAVLTSCLSSRQNQLVKKKVQNNTLENIIYVMLLIKNSITSVMKQELISFIMILMSLKVSITSFPR